MSCALALAGALACTTSPAAAQERPWFRGSTDAQREMARDFLDQGWRFARDGIYGLALRSLERSLSAWDHPGTHYDIALVHAATGRTRLAVEHFWRALMERGLALQGRHLERAAAALAAYTRWEVAPLELHTAGVAPADVTLVARRDGERVVPTPDGDGARALVCAGEHALEVAGQDVARVPLVPGRVTVVVVTPGRVEISLREATLADWRALQLATVGFVAELPSADERAWRAGRQPRRTRTEPNDTSRYCAKTRSPDALALCARVDEMLRVYEDSSERNAAALEQFKRLVDVIHDGYYVQVLE